MFQSPFSVGIDIGHHSVKAVALAQKKEGLELAAFSEVALPPMVINEQHNVNSDHLLSAMRQIKKQLPRGARQVALGLPDSAVISKIIQLDTNLNTDEIEFAVAQALASSSPFPVDDLRLDYFAVEGSNAAVSTATMPYQVFAARKSAIDERVAVLDKSGFSPKVMELQTHALLWLAKHFYETERLEGAYGVVDIGKHHTEFCVDPPDTLAFHREIAFGSDSVASSSALGASNFDASPAVFGSVSENSSTDVEQFTQQLADHLRRQIQLYHSTHPRYQLTGLWLCGGCQSLVVEELLERMLNLDIRWLNPFLRIATSNKVVLEPQRQYHQFGVATGLALRGVHHD
ncbi:pilus assembly protein PilM [Photobacterium jeanii]|uniref:Pilus assembly protein PilM n=1 Tax=Photobacterium jeanii TaxID=858640 RepID=A0A178KIF0_9GAMM|nr:type IV pilus assembly protein PilM [Photobacterium jeanii]OAN17057.1 pilus assembly protein PilM [Photobacterium jeanii]PST88346.1 pilus assembly protein PilM [Photobacterium jeanii]